VKYVFWIGVVALAIAEAGLLNAGFWVPLPYAMCIFNDEPGRSREPALAHSEAGVLVRGVQAYSVRDDGVAVRTERELFLVSRQGEVTPLDAGSVDGAMAEPSRTQDPNFRMAQVLLGAACVCWVALGFAVRRFGPRRQPMPMRDMT
jgi:hypothetical protein